MSVGRIFSIVLGLTVAAVLIGVPATPYLATAWHAWGDEILPRIVTGEAQVVDGDTIDIDDHRIRLWGIDAPETDQYCHDARRERWECGEEAARALAAFIDSRGITCMPRYRDRYDRLVAQCVRDNVDIGDYLVRRGWALDWPRYSEGYYAEAQEEAKASGAGMWRGTFMPPSRWRRSPRDLR